MDLRSEYISNHCFDIERTIPPTKAAQLEKPAISPKTKKASRDDFELTFTKPDNPNLFKYKNPIINNAEIIKSLKELFFLKLFSLMGWSENR